MIQNLMPILLTVHLLICLILIVSILLQRSEGGALGGLAGGPSSMMSGRSATNFMSRTTTVLAGLFFAMSLALSILGNQGRQAPTSVMDKGDAVPKAIELSGPKAPVNAVAPTKVDIPASSPTAPAPLFPPVTSKAAPTDKAAPEKK